MGILPLVFQQGDTRKTLKLTGDEHIDISLPEGVTELHPRQKMLLTIRSNEQERQIEVTSRLDTDNEIAYYQSGGILQFVLNNLIADG